MEYNTVAVVIVQTVECNVKEKGILMVFYICNYVLHLHCCKYWRRDVIKDYHQNQGLDICRMYLFEYF